MAGPDLGGRPSDGVPCTVHARLLGRRRGDLLGAVVLRIGVPFVLLLSKPPGNLKLKVGEGGDPGPRCLLGSLPSEVAANAGVMNLKQPPTQSLYGITRREESLRSVSTVGFTHTTVR